MKFWVCTFFYINVQAPGDSDVQKQNCIWLFVSHQKCTADDLVSCGCIYVHLTIQIIVMMLMILCKHEWSVSFVLQVSALDRSSKDAVLKFEPFVLHVQCRKLEDAQLVVRNRFIGFYLMNAQGVNTTKIIFLIKKKQTFALQYLFLCPPAFSGHQLRL